MKSAKEGLKKAPKPTKMELTWRIAIGAAGHGSDPAPIVANTT